jgi:O-antigen ligase
LVFWSTAAVTLYGGYDFFTALFDLPFFSVIYDLSYYAGGSDSPFFTVGGVTIPRPRSTLGEPLDLSIFLLFGIPYSIALLASERSASLRVVKICFIFLGCMLFMVSNSRASLLAIPVIVALMFWLTPGYVARLKMLLAGAVVYLLVALAIFPLAGGNGDVLAPIRFFAERMASLRNIGANLLGDPAGISIGRGYDTPFTVFREHPVFGVGLGNYPFYYSELVGSPIILLATTFSLYFRLLTELGIIGTALFLLFVSTALWRLLRVIKQSSDRMLRPFAVAALISIVGVMIARVGLDGLYTDSYMWVMLGVGVAIPWLANRGQESAVPEQRLATDPDIPAALIGRQVGIPSEPEGSK